MRLEDLRQLVPFGDVNVERETAILDINYARPAHRPRPGFETVTHDKGAEGESRRYGSRTIAPPPIRC
jgi:hypothetical protein